MHAAVNSVYYYQCIVKTKGSFFLISLCKGTAFYMNILFKQTFLMPHCKVTHSLIKVTSG